MTEPESTVPDSAGPDPAVPAKRDGLAVASLITGVLGFLGITAVLGLVFGIVALVRIRRTGERGRGFAIGGIAAGLAWAIVLPVAAVLLVSSLLSASNTPLLALQLGDCYNTARPGHDAVKVSCEGEHDGAVLESFVMAGPQVSFPGARKAQGAALASCEIRLSGTFDEFTTIPPELVLVGYVPDEEAWVAGNRTAVCGFQQRTGRLIGPWHR